MSEPPTDPERPLRAWRVALAVLGRLPQGLLSRATGALADLPLPRPVRRPLLGAFARAVGIEVAEAERPLADYPSVGAFFVRRLKPGARTWPDAPDMLASPVDGVLGRAGAIRAGTALQAKGQAYGVARLLGDPHAAARFEGGIFLTLYLAPRHYHRIHAPASGTVVAARHVPGRLLPVNAAAVRHVPDLFVTNERLSALLDTPLGPLALVAVGAYNVGRISTAFDEAWSGREGGWITNRGDPLPDERRYDPPLPVRAGDPLMAFHLGSTVVLLAAPGLVMEPGLAPGLEVRAGSILARRTSEGHLASADPPRDAPALPVRSDTDPGRSP
jgi:phosphatidylserine decarboxylase